jgi:hypothetical protein
MTAIKQYTISNGEKVPEIRGSKGGCFIAGTQISMADGSNKAIEDIEIGNLVLAFDKLGNLGPASVTKIFKHDNDQFIKLIHWKGELTLTPNHWVLIEDGLFLEAGKLTAGEDQLVTKDGKISPIDEIISVPSATSYNFTVSKQHTYIADDIRVHNKGGGKGGGGGGGAVEDPNDKFSTDIMFATIGIGEGPVYRINPNGPQDIEIQDGNIDSLINIDGDGLENTTLFKTLSNNGSVQQGALRIFGEEVATPQNFTAPVKLKKGNVGGIPESKVELQDTSAQAWDALRFAFELRGLINQDNKGNIHGHTAEVSIEVFDRTGVKSIMPEGEPHIETISGKTNAIFRFDVTILIPEEHRSDDGYKFTIKKHSDDSDSSKIHDNITVKGWIEIEYARQAYPRTAHVGYAIKAHSEHVGGVPNFTSIVKGLLVKVPSNYNQPILETGEIDWRELEIANGGSTGNSYQENGYSLQFSGAGTKLTASNPQIYVGTWDGTFVYSWTQNPVWIIYDILTNNTYGLGIPEDVIDKFKFYQVAQYCDACSSNDGKFQGVIALADGTWRHKPRGKFTTIRENQIGLSNSIEIVERRFCTDITIHDQGQVMDILNQMASFFRGALVYNMGKLTLAVDMPDELPVAMFNEANIKDGSFQISGIKESEIITGVDVSYLEPTNHYKRETVRIDTVDRNDGKDKSALENLTTLDLMGVTRRSQALRYAHYQIAASRYLRRRVNFTTSIEAINLAPGDVISVSQKQNGIGFGFGGKIRQDSLIGGVGDAYHNNVFLEYFTEPTLPATFFTANTDPLALRIFKQENDGVDLFLIRNDEYALITTTESKEATSTTSITSNANVNFGIDLANVAVTHKFNVVTRIFDAVAGFPANAAPKKGDLWMLGEMTNPGVPTSSAADLYTNKAGKLFKITKLSRTDEHEVQLEAIEYISNVYVDADTFIDYTPTAYTDIISPFIPPPAPSFELSTEPRRSSDGSVVVDVLINPFTERQSYPLKMSTDYFVSLPDVTQKIVNSNAGIATGSFPATFKVGNSAGLTDSLNPVFITGKNGFSGTTGEIRLLCNNINLVKEGGISDAYIDFTVEGLNVAFDFNFHKHVLNVNDADSFAGLKGSDRIAFPVTEKANSGAEVGFVGHNSRITQYTAPIVAFNSNGTSSGTVYPAAPFNHIIITNSASTDGTKLDTTIPDPPFYITINQLVDARHYSNNSFYVSGSEFVYTRSNSISLIAPVSDSTASATSHIEPLEINPRDKGFVTAYVDGIQISSSAFNLHQPVSPHKYANIEFLSLSSSDVKVRVEVDQYTVPALEVGDNIQFSTGNIFSVIATSYSPGQEATNTFTSNAAMTSNNIYTITTGGESPKANVGGLTFVNISPDVQGTLGNVSSDQFTLDYNTLTYPGQWKLANNGIYNLTMGSDYNQLFLTADRVIPDVRIGPLSVKGRNRNFQGRTSPFITKTLIIDEIPIRKVTGVGITESLFIDRNQGVSVRATVEFSHITGQEVTDYEIAFKLSGEAADLTNFNTVKVSAAGVDDDGKIRFTINNLDRGSVSGRNNIIVRITPLNKEIRGVQTEFTHTILGKTAAPTNVSNLSVGQSTDQITIFWQYPDPIELDLQEVVIRRMVGEQNPTVANFVLATPLVAVSSGVNRKSVPIDTFGEFTYLARTRDTSGNFSDDVVGFTFTSVEPVTDEVVAAFSEDSPSVNFTTITNTNSGEANYPSFNTSNSAAGRYITSIPSSVVDNANGTSSGFSALADVDDLSLTGSQGIYFTQIRDLGLLDFYRVQVNFEGTQTPQTSYNDLKVQILSDVSEAQSGTPLANVVKATGIGTYINTSNVIYDSNNRSLVDTESAGITNDSNVLAIWNNGKYTGSIFTISAVTRANPGVITTSAAHGLTGSGNRAIIHDVVGMTELNNQEIKLTRVSDTTLSIQNMAGSGLDTSSYTTYSSGGVIDQGDYANANSYALIAGIIDADRIELSDTYFANGTLTGSNAFANVGLDAGNTFLLVDLRDYDDSSTFTFDGGGSDVTVTTKMRISTRTSNVYLDPPFGEPTANPPRGNVNTAAFIASATDDGYQTFEAGEKNFRYMQLKFIIDNLKPDENDYTIDKIRYKITKGKKVFDETITYDAIGKTVDWSDKNFTRTPSVSLTVIDGGNATFGVFSALSNVNGTVKLFQHDGSNKAGDSSASINVRAEGV